MSREIFDKVCQLDSIHDNFMYRRLQKYSFWVNAIRNTVIACLTESHNFCCWAWTDNLGLGIAGANFFFQCAGTG